MRWCFDLLGKKDSKFSYICTFCPNLVEVGQFYMVFCRSVSSPNTQNEIFVFRLAKNVYSQVVLPKPFYNGLLCMFFELSSSQI
jgi:hypothetical protein